MAAGREAREGGGPAGTEHYSSDTGQRPQGSRVPSFFFRPKSLRAGSPAAAAQRENDGPANLVGGFVVVVAVVLFFFF